LNAFKLVFHFWKLHGGIHGAAWKTVGAHSGYGEDRLRVVHSSFEPRYISVFLPF
jgi:hypothetical protein